MRFPFPASADAGAGEPPPIEHPPILSIGEELSQPSKQVVAEPATEFLAPEPADGWNTGSQLPEFVREQIAAEVEKMIAAEESAPPGEPAAPSRVAPLPRPLLRRKVIAFPRHLMATPDNSYRLADPVAPERLRILDVPEELEAVSRAPFLDGLQFDARTPQPAQPYHPELPMAPATLAQRGYATLLDLGLVALGFALSGAIARKILPGLLLSTTALATACLMLAVLWMAYQYLFLVYAGATVGMRIAGIRLLTFKGSTLSGFDRRNRALALVLSTASLAMGLLWALVDADSLCWHDRITQTYLTGA